MKKAQRQHAECNRRLQQTEGNLALMKERVEELTSEKSHMDQQLCVYLKDFEVERQAREMEVQSIDNLKKKLAEAKEETTSLRHQLNQQADQIRQVCRPFVQVHVLIVCLSLSVLAGRGAEFDRKTVFRRWYGPTGGKCGFPWWGQCWPSWGKDGPP